MARTVDQGLRDGVLDACVEAALKMGIRNISLAELSKRTRVSRRMLIYHFGSVEKLVEETLSGAEKRIHGKLHTALSKDRAQDSRKAILLLWRECISPSMEQSIRAYFHLYVEAMDKPQKYRAFVEKTVYGWIQWFKNELSDEKSNFSEAELTALVAVLRGLLLDYWATGNRTRTTKALESFLSSLPAYRTQDLKKGRAKDLSV